MLIFIELVVCSLCFVLVKGHGSIDKVSQVDPQVWMNITEVIRSYGYPCEDHEVITEDGYILSMQRIPHGIKNGDTVSQRRPVLLQHGLVDSAHTWANNLPNQSLAFILADSGYDVWLANSRGNLYSSKHVRLNPDDHQFWEFSWDQMARYDLPACVAYVLKVNGNATKLAYIGHSQGTMIALARIPMDPILSSKLAVFIALAPVAYLGHVESGLRILARLKAEIKLILGLFGHGRVLPSTAIMRNVLTLLCGNDGIPEMCEDAYFLLIGHDSTNFNKSRIPVYFSHNPAGTSLMTLLHYAQAVDGDSFQMFDYDTEGNKQHYNQSTPPQYSFAKYNVPTVFFSGGNDTLADATDVDRLIPLLGANLKVNRKIATYNHMDFVLAMNANVVIYPQVMQIINQYLPIGHK